jgi:peptidoglycan hydrolase-like protein with peptidoglycan-binding domain
MPERFRTPRWAALAVIVAVLIVSTAAYGITRVAATDESAPTTTSSTTTSTRPHRPSTTTTTSSTTTTTAPTTTTGPRADDGVLERGDRGPEVVALQKRLAELHFDAGVPDGSFGLATMYAVEGFQNLAGMRADGKVGPQVAAALADPPAVAPLVPDGEPTRVEVDKSRQLLFVWTNNQLRLISHVSTGSGKTYCVDGSCNNKAITPEGAFRFMWRYSGWRESRLGKLYNPVYFTGSGVAVHGSPSVPTYPASHGCVRIPMHISEYFPSLVKRGDAVYVLAGPGSHVGAPPARSTPTGPPPTDPPTSPDSTSSTTTSTTTTSTTSTTTPQTTTTTTTPTTTTSITAL